MMNRRSHTRVPLPGRVYLTYQRRCRSDRVVDLSAGGLKVETQARLKVGRAVKVFLPMPGKQSWRLCMVHGTVVRREKQKNGPSQVAIAWNMDAVDNRQALVNYCERFGTAQS